MEVGIGPVILCTELSNCLYNRIEGYGSGDKERHNGGCELQGIRYNVSDSLILKWLQDFLAPNYVRRFRSFSILSSILTCSALSRALTSAEMLFACL